MTQRVIFLDIDGPMIPDAMFLKNVSCSFEREFSPVSIIVIKRLCMDTGARIVFNTCHNTEAEQLVEAWKAQVDGALLHNRCHTAYPQISRYHAIRGWLTVEMVNTGEEPEWVALDDEYIGKEEDGYILVDPDAGLTLAHYNKVRVRWGLRPLFL